MKSDKPIIVSMGEPSGISSEIIIKVWLKRDLYKIPPFILVDDLKKLNQVKSFFNLNAHFQVVTKDIDINEIFSRSLPVIDLKANIDFVPGIPDQAPQEGGRHDGSRLGPLRPWGGGGVQ